MLEQTADFPARLFEPDEVITMPGDKSKAAFVLESGSVAITKNGTQLGVITKPGSVVGELASLLESDRTATVTAREPCQLRVIDDPLGLLRSNGEVRLATAIDIDGKIRSSRDHIMSIRAAMENMLSPDSEALGRIAGNETAMAFLGDWANQEQFFTDAFFARFPFELDAPSLVVGAGESVRSEEFHDNATIIVVAGEVTMSVFGKPMSTIATPGAMLVPGSGFSGNQSDVVYKANQESEIKVIRDTRQFVLEDTEGGLAFARYQARRLVSLSTIIAGSKDRTTEFLEICEEFRPGEFDHIIALHNRAEADMTARLF